MRSLDISPKLWPLLDQEDIKVSNVIFSLHRLPLEMQSWWGGGEHLTRQEVMNHGESQRVKGTSCN